MSDDFFNDAIPSCSFRGDPPIVWEGEILELTKKQATTYDPDNPGAGEPRFWPDGNPMMQGWITLQTDVRNPEIEDDDGRRVMVLDSKNKREAVHKAVKATGQKIAIGGRLRVEFFGRDPNGKNPDNLPKLYRAVYTPPSEVPVQVAPPTSTASAATGTGGGNPSGQTPVTTATVAGSSGGADPADVVKCVSAGIDITGKTAEQIKMIASVL